MKKSYMTVARRTLLRSTLASGLLGAAGCSEWLARRPGERVALEPSLEQFRTSLEGRVIVPQDREFELARRPASFNRDTDKRPAVISLCANPDDVARSIEFALRHDLEIAVRGGGHDVLGRSTCADGLLIDLALMNDVEVRPDQRTARVEAGCRAGPVNAALQEHGFAVPLGCNLLVGVGGLTLGGGLGWLLGRFGATCDNLAAIEAATADGRKVRASAEDNADLFWAMRGGGGNFAVATAFEFHMHEVGQATGGYVVYRGADTPQFLRYYRELMADAPDELTVETVLFASPEPPHEPLLIAAVCHSGAPEAAERDLAGLLKFGPPLVHSIRRTPYANVADPPPELARLFGVEPSDRPEPVADEPAGGGFNYWRGASMSDWSDASLDAFVACAAAAPPGWSMGVGHYMHGEICRIDASASPLLRRQASASYFFNIGWGDAGRSEAAIGWVNQSIAAMKPHSNEPAYINYLSEESETAVAAAYGPHYARLRSIKKRFDPDNVFHLNRNIAPPA